MTSQPFRLDAGGLIDRAKPLSFRFDGRTLSGYEGDTLASALMANGVRLVARSFKYHRPRGILTIGSEEPNALVHLGEGARREPNTRATVTELYDGLTATPQHAWPSLRFDLGRLNGLFAPFLTAGFYYKTFMGPFRSSWMFYERFIRASAGLGKASREPDPDIYEKMHASADVVIIGGGVTGLSAALAAGGTGARVILIDEAARLGGWLLRESGEIDGIPGAEWAAQAVARLSDMRDVRLLTRTTGFGLFDGGTVGAVERRQDHVRPNARKPRQRMWIIRAKHIVLASGAIEQPLVFPGNDRPGVMLAGAARGYVNQYAVMPGRRVAIHTNNDDAYRTALDLHAAGIEVRAVIDSRDAGDVSAAAAEAARITGAELFAGASVAKVNYGLRLVGVDVAVPGRRRQFVDCDCLAMSGGWAPAIHLASHLGGKPVYEPRLGKFLAGADAGGVTLAGACAGETDLDQCREAGHIAGLDAAGTPSPARRASPPATSSEGPIAATTAGTGFVDFQNDVTANDVALAAREGYRSVEHMKRYTTLGMGTDQGKTANIAALTLLGQAQGLAPGETGITTFRPPYTPVTLGALAGADRGQHLAPLRRTPLQVWHEANGAVMTETGLWRRPKSYPRAGENAAQAGQREVNAVRHSLGITDVSTLGKIAVQGPDAATFLDRVFCTPIGVMQPGSIRHALMLREDGFILEDCTVCRLGDDHFYLTTTTAHAGKVMDHLERYAQVVWPELRVRLTSLSDHFAAIAVAGRNVRAMLTALGTDIDLDSRAMPYASIRTGTLGGVAVRLLRLSYSGECSYEIHVPAGVALGLWLAALKAGHAFDITPYGTEAMGVMRIEKGYPAGGELDGRVTPADLGMMQLVDQDKDFVGKVLGTRPGLSDPNRPTFAGFIPVDRNTPIKAGAQLTADTAPPPVESIGHISSACFSPTLGYPIALGLIAGGDARHGETVYARFPLRDEIVPVKVVRPVFFDPDGRRFLA